ncbi:hypothetical protein BC828DRAFT_388842 [Blastocladiella britannica]|nr:hypothetical protein BC828DRAFT_388842 [Blastocladiella britannica]
MASAPVPRRSDVMCCEVTSSTLAVSASSVGPPLLARTASVRTVGTDTLSDPPDGDRTWRIAVDPELRRTPTTIAVEASSDRIILVARGASWIGVGSSDGGDVYGLSRSDPGDDLTISGVSTTVSASVLAQRTPAAIPTAAGSPAVDSVLVTRCHFAMVCLTISVVAHRTRTTPVRNPTAAAGISATQLPCDPLEVMRLVGPFATTDMAKQVAIDAVAAPVMPARIWLVTDL